MIVTYNWLKEFVDFDLTPEDLSHRLTMAGLEVDAMEITGQGLDTVIVARLDVVDRHPDADKLTLCQVDTGSEIVQVVCGAQNHRAGDLVALAQVGSVLPGDFQIKKSKIRGQVSMGMLCSEKELGLAEESDGILILTPGLELGQPVFFALGLKDVRFELGLTPNRSDCLSVMGVAREVAAMVGKPLHVPAPEFVEHGAPIETLTSVEISEPELCPRYAARLIQGVKIGPSPEWMVKRLESIGMRSINNVVDVTNYVLMELGHPLHAFDFNLLKGRRIVVRRAAEGSEFKSLDSQKRNLIETDLVICDAEAPVALAGIMGGENSEVQPDTVDILLESAYFNPTTIRRTSKRLGIHTESSHRFERGADVDIVPVALDRAAGLIAELAGGTVAKGKIDVYPRVIEERELTISAGRVHQVLGLQVDLLEIKNLLASIGLHVSLITDVDCDRLRVRIPLFRPDLEREIDLIEEVARLAGYDRIPVTMPMTRIAPHAGSRQQGQVPQLRNLMVEAGFSEVINYSFFSRGLFDRAGLDAADERRKTVAILNPLTEEQSVMRTTLVPSMLETVSRNLAYRSLDLKLFELRPVFLPVEGQELPVEKLRLVAVMSGRRQPEGWAQSADTIDFFDIKGVVESLFMRSNAREVRFDGSNSENFLHPGKSCFLKVGNKVLGSLGEVHPATLDAFGIDQPVFLFDLDLEAVLSVSRGFGGFTPLSKFPDVYRDSAFLVDDAVAAEKVLGIIDKARARISQDVVLFDLYKGKGVPEGKKSLAVRVRYRSTEKTLSDEEIQAAHGKIVKALQKEIGAEIR